MPHSHRSAEATPCKDSPYSNQTGLIKDRKSLHQYTRHSFARAVLHFPLVLLVAALFSMAQFCSHTLCTVHTKLAIYGQILIPSEPASAALALGHYVEHLILLLLFVVFLIEQLLVMP